MAKLTQKAKLIEAAVFAQRVRNQANYLSYVSNDDDYYEGKKIAKELKELSEEFLKLI